MSCECTSSSRPNGTTSSQRIDEDIWCFALTRRLGKSSKKFHASRSTSSCLTLHTTIFQTLPFRSFLQICPPSWFLPGPSWWYYLSGPPRGLSLVVPCDLWLAVPSGPPCGLSLVVRCGLWLAVPFGPPCGLSLVVPRGLWLAVPRGLWLAVPRGPSLAVPCSFPPLSRVPASYLPLPFPYFSLLLSLIV
jgi:hypothetical protein